MCYTWHVSIPNGKPILFRRGCRATEARKGIRFNPKREAHPLQTLVPDQTEYNAIGVSIPNGKPILFRPSSTCQSICMISCFNPKREAHPLQTTVRESIIVLLPMSFNPKREAHPLQTFSDGPGTRLTFEQFQSQTGSPSSSDLLHSCCRIQAQEVSIPNGKPILFRL